MEFQLGLRTCDISIDRWKQSIVLINQPVIYESNYRPGIVSLWATYEEDTIMRTGSFTRFGERQSWRKTIQIGPCGQVDSSVIPAVTNSGVIEWQMPRIPEGDMRTATRVSDTTARRSVCSP